MQLHVLIDGLEHHIKALQYRALERSELEELEELEHVNECAEVNVQGSVMLNCLDVVAYAK